MGSLRSMQHKDQYGNIISEPDLSNPTRPRFERPLDTIRSFEAAIYGQYASNRMSYAQTGEDVPPTPGDYSRRSSYYNPYSHGHNRQYSDRGYPNSRPNYSRPNSYYDNGNGYYNGGGPSESYPYNQGGGRRPRQHHRGHSDHPSYTNQQNGHGYPQNGYAQNGYYKSSDNVTVASPSGSGSTPDQWANSTDPSSINSSLDQFQQQQQLQQQQQQEQQAIAESYGFQGFGAGPNINEQTFASNAAGKAPYGQAPTPAPPVHDPNAGGPVGGPPLVAGRRHLQRKSMHQPQQSVSSDAGDNGNKRKSWFKRTFSKNS
ncbi:uncharacterized protein BDV17DRAFT_268330 [Aspergillus undulatus]|uniref:uncharacterized protein n=1 Tax=Aspergillus undulatus TaxID=1810928 RepID=UPI003CCE5351